MNSRLIALFCGVLFGISLSAQTSSIDFSAPMHQFSGFGGCGFSVVADPVNPSNNTGKLVNVGTAWEGIYLNLPDEVVLASQNQITLSFYNTVADTTLLLLKLEEGTDVDVDCFVTVSGQGWQTVTFDYSNALVSGGGNPINATGSYDKMVFFVNGPDYIPGTYYIDDIVYANYESVHSLDVVYTDLAWSDEFAYFGPVDTNAWFAETVAPNSWGWHNGEKQHYTDRTDNSFVSNGTLKIVAKSESYTSQGLTLNYTSARLTSIYEFTYGRVDIRAKLPFGEGTWPALWMLGTSIGNSVHPPTISWPDCGEIDIMEHWGNDQNEIHGSIHNRSSFGATVNTNTLRRDSVSDEFHVYSMNWSPDQISFLFDGQLYYTYHPNPKDIDNWPFNDPQFFILNIAMGSSWYDIDPNFVESQMEVDYIRVFQNNVSVEESTHVNSKISLYPNPSNNVFTVYSQEEKIEVIRVIDINGKELIQINGGQRREVKIENVLPAGFYFVQVQTSSGIEVVTVQIQ